jgi:SAM-dependent methyltransferase
LTEKEQTLETYNRSAAGMAAKFKNIGSRLDDVKRAFALVESNNPVVFEVGCGDGRDAAEIIKLTDHYTGIDISEGMINEAKKHLPGVDFLVADIEGYDFPSGIDIIFAFASLLHSDQSAVSDVLKRAHDGLKQGGIFYISLKLSDKYEKRIKEDEFGTRTFYFYTIEKVKELAGLGYESVHEDTQTLLGVDWFTLALRKI